MRKLVSILIPAFNAQEWIADALGSAIAQTYPGKEIIVVDDGSMDETRRIASRFESATVWVISQPNQGAAAARNKALSVAQGEWIQWLDADDVLAPDKIARQVDAAERLGSDSTLLSAAWGQFLYRQSRAQFIPTSLWSDLSPVEWMLRKLGGNLFMQTATWLVSRRLTEAGGPWNETLIVDDDGEYFCRVLLASDGVHFVPGAKVYYRDSGAGRVSHIGTSRRKAQSQWRSMQLHIQYLRSLEESERVRAACLGYLQSSLIHFYPENQEILKELENIAEELGGRIDVPRISSKYSWIAMFLGWKAAKFASRTVPGVRWSLQRIWDKALCGLERRRIRP